MNPRASTQTVQFGKPLREGFLTVPDGCAALVLFAHGSGSSRFSSRNTHVARALNGHGLATLQFDLLSETEAQDRSNVFNIELLAARVVEAIEWAQNDERTRSLALCLFGASTGAAAALTAAAHKPDAVTAIVSRGGRPDLAASVLPAVRAPTLLVVGAHDTAVIALNESAFNRLKCPKSLVLVPRATHLFEETGALDAVVEHAADWFERCLRETVQ